MVVSLVNCGTSVFAGFVIYSILGYRQHQGIGDIETVSLKFFLTKQYFVPKLAQREPRAYLFHRRKSIAHITLLYFNIDTQVGSGSGLAFVAISEAVSAMSAPYIWSILFFTMLILLGLDSEFGTLEGAVTPLVIDMNLFPKIRKEIVSGR